MNQRPSPTHSAAMRIRSALSPSSKYRKPLPSSPTSVSAGTSRSSKNSSVVAWFIIVRIGRIVRPWPMARRMSTSRIDRPAVLFGNKRPQVAGVGQRLHEGLGVRALDVELAPVGVWKRLTEIADGGPQVLMQLDSWQGASFEGGSAEASPPTGNHTRSTMI